MNRKLHNSLMALSTTGLLLVVGLMAATPVGTADPASATNIARTAIPPFEKGGRGGFARPSVQATAEANPPQSPFYKGGSEAVDARAKAFEEEFRNAGDAQRAIALTAGFIAETATEAALAAALAELNGETPVEAEPAPPARETPRKRRNTRSALALPYFSFARGLRGGNGS